MTTQLIRSSKDYTNYNLVQDGVIISTGHSKHKFAAIGKRADGTRFDRATDLGIQQLSDGVYSVSDVAKFSAFMVTPTTTIPPTAAYLALQNEGYTEPKFIDNTPYQPTDY